MVDYTADIALGLQILLEALTKETVNSGLSEAELLDAALAQTEANEATSDAIKQKIAARREQAQ
jgi:hypothetical protein